MSSNNISSMHINMPKGTSFQDGVRVGPYFSQPQPISFNANGFPAVNLTGGVNTRQALGNMSAPGALLAPLLTVALAPNASGAAGNICAQTPAAGMALNSWIPLSAGDGKATTKRQVAGSKYEEVINSSFAGKALKFLEMDYPRCVTATLAVASAANQTFDVYGLDMYGQPLTSRITIETGAGKPLTVDSSSAFAVVFGVQVIAAMANGVRVTITASNKNFGLPYYLPSGSCVAYGGGYPADAGDANPGIITGVDGYVPIGDVLPTAVSADVRGTLSLATPINGITYLYAGVYCPGFDNMINQLNAAGASNVTTPVTMAMQYGRVPYFNKATAQTLVQMVNPVAAEAPVVKAELKAEAPVVKAEVKKK